jgi:two-component system response regulator AtoC
VSPKSLGPSNFKAEDRSIMPETAQHPATILVPPRSSASRLLEPDPARVVGVSSAWRRLLTQAELTAAHLQIATIEGESGSGKQTLASYLFERSPLTALGFQRRDTREWLATEADPTNPSGFLYLDRVDLLTPPGQNLLLAVLKAIQDRPSARAVLLASSQTSLRQLANRGHFLTDLAFRLTAIRFIIPPLRERREDIAPLAQYLLDRLCLRYQQRTISFGPGTLTRLLQHHWPGNVRELSSVLESALLESPDGIIRPSDLAIPDPPDPESSFVPPAIRPAAPPSSLALDAAIRHHIHYVLDLNRGNKLRAARQLRISRSTLYRILANQSRLTI